MQICRKIQRQLYGAARIAVALFWFAAALFVVSIAAAFDASAQAVSQSKPETQLRTALHPAVPNKDVRRLQRLLKLLANQNPSRFSSVDPGVIDGRLGAGTVRAIRNFQRISNVSETGVITRDLYTQIITAQSESPAPDFAPKQNTTPSVLPTKPTVSGPANAPASQRYAQLGSIKEESRIVHEWMRLQEANPDYLKGRAPIIEMANLGDRGTYYRILVGPFKNFERARTFCSALRKQKQSCLVKKGLGETYTANREQLQIAKPKVVKAERVSPLKPEAQADPVDLAKKKARTSLPDPADDQTSKPPADPPVAVVETAMEKQETSIPVPPPAPTIVIAPGAPAASPEAGELQTKDTATADPNKEETKYPAGVELPTGTKGKAGANSQLSALSPRQADSVSERELAKQSDQAVSGDAKPTAAPPPPATTLVQWLTRVGRISAQYYMGPTIAAAAGTVFGLLILVWHQRRRRNLAFEAILVSPWFEDSNRDETDQAETFAQSEKEPEDLLEELRTQFDADDLVESRRARDTFLNGIPELNNNASVAGYSGEYAMLVNRKLNQLLSSDPDTYKSIFLNWIFLNHVADRISSSEYTMKRLDPRIQDEFRLLASLFKIHLLELEARHHVRQRLPNIFAALNGL